MIFLDISNVIYTISFHEFLDISYVIYTISFRDFFMENHEKQLNKTKSQSLMFRNYFKKCKAFFFSCSVRAVYGGRGVLWFSKCLNVLLYLFVHIVLNYAVWLCIEIRGTYGACCHTSLPFFVVNKEKRIHSKSKTHICTRQVWN